MKNALLLFCTLVLIHILPLAQTWQPLGGLLLDQVSDGNCTFPVMAIDTFGHYYVAYVDQRADYSVTVRKYDGTSWKTLGNRGLSGVSGSNISIVVTKSGTPYIAYTNNSETKTVIQMYDGSTWVDLGPPAAGGMMGYRPKLAIDSRDIPYLAYSDTSGVRVAKYDNSSWVQVGGTVIPSYVNTLSLCISPSDSVYLAYSTGSPIKVSVKKFNGTDWSLVGNAGFTNSALSSNIYDMAVDGNGAPYVFYHHTNSGNHYGQVMKYNGSAWINIDSVGLKADYQGITGQIEIDKNNVPYVAFEYWNNNYFMAVYKLDADKWTGVSSPATPAGLGVYYLFNVSMVLDKNGVPSICYSPVFNSYVPQATISPAVVLQYTGSSWVPIGTNKYNTDDITFRSLDVYQTTPYAIVTNGRTEYAVIKYSGANWELLGKENFARPQCITVDKTGVPYVATTNLVLKYDGNNWIKVGDTLSTKTEVYLAFDNNNTPYLAGTNSNITVVKFNGTSWVPVGNTISTGSNSFKNVSIALDKQGTPFIGFCDTRQIAPYYQSDGRTGVMKLVGSTWQFVGDSLLYPADALPAPLVLDTAGQPLVAHTATRNFFESMNDYRMSRYLVATLEKYTTNWNNVGTDVPISGNSNLMAPGARILRLGNDNTPYMIMPGDSLYLGDYFDAANAQVLKYTNNSWSPVGNKNLATGTDAYNWVHKTMALGIDDNNVLYAVGNNTFGYKYMQTPNEPTLGSIINNDSAVCAGDSITITFSTTGTFNTGNIFTVQIATTYSTGPAVNVASIPGTTGGTYRVRLPDRRGFDLSYMLRVVSSDPPLQGLYSKRLIEYPGPVTANAGADQTLSGCQTITLGGSPTGTTNIVNPYQPYPYPYVDEYAQLKYYWTPSNGLDTIRANPKVSGLSANTTYALLVKDYYGCSARDTVSVTIDNDLNPGVTIAAVTENGITVNDGDTLCSFTRAVITATPTRAGSSPTYTWYSREPGIGSSFKQWGPTTDNVFYTRVGWYPNPYELYCIMQPDGTGCTTEAFSNRIATSARIAPDYFPTLTTNTGDTICPGTSVTFSIKSSPAAPAGASYGLVINNVTVQQSRTPVFVTNQLKNNDQVYGTMFIPGNQCADSFGYATYSRTFKTATLPPVVDAGQDKTICPGDSVRLGGSPTASSGKSPYVYNWSNNTGTVANPWVAPVQNTKYKVTVTDSRNCTATDSVTVAMNAPPSVTITATDDTICRGSSATYTATPTNAGTAQTYNWLFNGSSLQNSSSPTYKFNTAPARATNMKPNYAILCVMTVTGNCGSANKDTSNQLSLAILDKPIKPAIAGPTNDKCGGDTASFSCTAVPNATVYTWNFTGGGNVVSGQGTNKVVVLMSDTFVIGQLSVTAGNSCVTTTPAIHTVKCAHFKAGGDETTGIDEEGTTGISLNIYPNPNNGNMFIDIQQPEAGAISFTIYNIIGQPVYEYTAAGYASSYRQWVNLNTQPAGVYFLKAKIGNTVVTKNLVITK